MTFKQFTKWCNDRACDGLWGAEDAIELIEAGSLIARLPWWKREKAWKNLESRPYYEYIIRLYNSKLGLEEQHEAD